MHKIIPNSRYFSLEFSETGTDKVNKKYNYFSIKHSDPQPQEIKRLSTNRYVFIHENLVCLDIDSFKGLQILFDFIDIRLTSINLINCQFENQKYDLYLNGKKFEFIYDKNKVIIEINKLNKQRKLEEHTVESVIAYGYFFAHKWNCQIDLTCNSLLHLYFKPSPNFKFGRQSIKDIELISNGCITISSGKSYYHLFNNSTNELTCFDDTILQLFNKQSTNEISDTVKFQYLQSDISRVSDITSYMKELRIALVELMPVECIDDYNTWIKLIICLKTIGVKLKKELKDLFIEMSKRSSKFKSEDKSKWDELEGYEIHEKFIFNTLRENGIVTKNDFNKISDKKRLNADVDEMMDLYLFKYFDSINQLVYRKDHGHYHLVKETQFSKMYYNIFKHTPKSFKQYIANMIYIISSRCEHVTDEVYNYKYLIPFKDMCFDLKLRNVRQYRETDYILIDVGYNFPLDAWMKSRNDKSYLNQECLRSISEMFFTKQEETFMWKCLSDNLNRTCENDTFLILWGQKCNGKSSILKMIRNAFGELDTSISSSYLSKKSRSTSGEPEYYNLLYSFYQTFPEIPICLNSEVIKANVSGDRMSFRMLYSNEYISFNPSFKMVMCANTIPRFTVFDGGIMRRIQIVPFKIRFINNPRLEHEKQANTEIRNKFSSDKSWRDTFMIRLIDSFYMPPSNISSDKIIIKQIMMMNENLLGYLFDHYTISEDSLMKIPFKLFVERYKEYMDKQGLTKEMYKTAKIIDIFASFDIAYDPTTQEITNLKYIVDL